jgi:hypothetical protein
MKLACVRSKFLGKIALLLAMTVLSTLSSLAQNLQVMVVGPWSYVSSGGRLYLVASGKSKSHKVYLLPGTNPNPSYPPQTQLGAGIYTLDLVMPGTYTAPTGLITPTLCPAAPSSVLPVLQDSSNYVISLPMPKAYSTYSGPMGTSESEVSATPIVDPTTVQPQQYTTWMVLYYPQAQGLSDQKKNTYGGGASIVLTDYGNSGDDANDAQCDHVSLESVHERNILWNIQQYARFPELKDMIGHQILGFYSAQCSSSDPNGHPKAEEPLNAVSSADCHACQMNINGAITMSVDVGPPISGSAAPGGKK